MLPYSKSISFLVEIRNIAEDSTPHSPSLSLPLAKLRSMQPEGAIIIRWLGDEMMGRKAATKHTNTQTHFCNSISCFNEEANSETKLSFWCEKIWKIGRICERKFLSSERMSVSEFCTEIAVTGKVLVGRLSHRLPCFSPKHTEKSALESRAFLIFRCCLCACSDDFSASREKSFREGFQCFFKFCLAWVTHSEREYFVSVVSLQWSLLFSAVIVNSVGQKWIKRKKGKLKIVLHAPAWRKLHRKKSTLCRVHASNSFIFLSSSWNSALFTVSCISARWN